VVHRPSELPVGRLAFFFLQHEAFFLLLHFFPIFFGGFCREREREPTARSPHKV
jgi:hypothetical protein